MYLEHFGLRELPFTLSPNTEFFIALEGHHTAMVLLNQALNEGNGHVRISGEVGTGKTLLCRQLLQTLNDNYVPVYIPNPFLSPEGLTLALIRELDGQDDSDADLERLQTRLNRRLQELKSSGKKVLLLLDDVQAMPEDTLHTLLDLPYLDDMDFLKLVFVGQPELEDLLTKEQLQTLNARVRYRYCLPRLTREETGSYINNRLASAGFPGLNLFTEQAVEQIYKSANGNPRMTNLLCHKALLAALSKSDTRVNYLHVLRAIEETADIRDKPPEIATVTLACSWRTMLLACMGASAMAFTLVWTLILH